MFSGLLVMKYFVTVLTPEEMLTSNAVAVTWSYRVLGNAGWLMSLIVCLSVFGALSASFLAGGRLPYAAARNGHLPQVCQTLSIGPYLKIPSQNKSVSEYRQYNHISIIIIIQYA